MVSLREWAVFGMGLTTGGLSAWALARQSRPGLIISIENTSSSVRDAIGPTTYLVQESVVKAVAARAASVARKGKPGSTSERVDMLLIGVHRRGVLSFVWSEQGKYGDLYEVSMLDAEQGLPEWGIRHGQPTPSIRDVLVELAAYGLARPGLAFRSYADFNKGKASGRLNLEVIRDAPREVEVEVERQRPSGSYFKVGDSYYADGKFHERMEWIPGSDYDEKTFTTTVPLWKRGKLLFKEMGKARMLPEQQGGLYLLTSELNGVDLEDVLTELVQLGLVGWGGEWTTIPNFRDYPPPTGTPKWNPSGKVRAYEGRELIDEVTLKQMLTRLESTRSPDGTIQITWRGRSLQLRPTAWSNPGVGGKVYGLEGKVYSLDPSSDPNVMAFVEELILRRIAYRVKDAASRAPRPELPVGHIYFGDDERLVDEAFVEALRVRADGWSFNPNDQSINFRFGLNADINLHPWDLPMGVAPILVDQVGGAYVLELKGAYGRKPDEQWFSQLIGDIVNTREGNSIRGTPLISLDPASTLAPPGHLYTSDPPIIDGRLAGIIKPYAERVIVVESGVDLDLGEAGMISLRLLSRKVGAMFAVGALQMLPNHVGAAFEVDLSRLSPQHPLWFRDLITSLVEKGVAKRVELPSPKSVNVKYRSFLTSEEAGQP